MLLRLLKAMRRVVTSGNAGSGDGAPANQRAENGDVIQAQQAAAYFAAGRYAEARPFYEAMCRRDPADAEALFRLGVIYGNIGMFNDAEEILERAIRARPHSVDVLNAQANVAWLQSAWPRAEQLFLAALELEPRNVALLANFGLCLHDTGRLEAAADALQRALELDPVHPDALVNAALVRLDLADAGGARALLQRALAVAPDFPEAHALHAQLLLRQGQYEEGWREYEWRLRCGDAHDREDTVLPRWDGAVASSRALMIYAEQGLGDQIMFASCLAGVLTRVANCEVECDRRLLRLFARSFPAVRFHAQQTDLERPWAVRQVDAASHIHAGSLPQLFRGAREHFPVHSGYLKPDPVRIAFWSGMLAKLGAGLKVGIVWRGGVPRTRQSMRSIALPEWSPLLQMHGVHFVSLQHGGCEDELREFAANKGVPVSHWQQAIDDCDETAALIAALDVVICVCGSVVHLAGAVGKTTWVMVPACAEWRYLGTGDTMPWYPAVRLFRQSIAGDWRGPLTEAAQLLSAVIQRRDHAENT